MEPVPAGVGEGIHHASHRNQSGTLDPTEVHKLIRNIPNLQIADYMLLIAFLYEADINEDGNLSSVAVLSKIPLRSPRKLFIFVIKKYIYRIKVSKK